MRGGLAMQLPALSVDVLSGPVPIAQGPMAARGGGVRLPPLALSPRLTGAHKGGALR